MDFVPRLQAFYVCIVFSPLHLNAILRRFFTVNNYFFTSVCGAIFDDLLLKF